MMTHVGSAGAVLIVEDDAESARGLAEMLELMGHRCEIAENGKVALARLQQGPKNYCLILLDIMMPVMNGWDFLVEHGRDARVAAIPVVLVTAAVDVHAKAAATNAVAVLTKPVDTSKLTEAVRQYC